MNLQFGIAGRRGIFLPYIYRLLLKQKLWFRCLSLSQTFSYDKVHILDLKEVILRNRCLVLRSTTNDVFRNLAFENWLYENFDYGNNKLLFLWRNDPSIVVGRFQNVWQECDVVGARSANVNIARRYSGGGTVFHDRGNLNFTFFTSKELYNRKTNLQFICNAMKLETGQVLTIGERDDLLLDGSKVSGTAAKVGLKKAYHHCTLLCHSDIEHMKHFLKPTFNGISARATKSIPSPTVNILTGFSDEDWQHYTLSFGNYFLKNNMINSEGKLIDVEFSDDALEDSVRFLNGWEWKFANTPKFSWLIDDILDGKRISFSFHIVKGCIDAVSISEANEMDGILEFLSTLKGTRLCTEEFESALGPVDEKSLKNYNNVKELLCNLVR